MTTTTWAMSPNATAARELVEPLQRRFVAGLEALSAAKGHTIGFRAIDWQRDEGRHGGGSRYVAAETPIYNRAAVNVSSVHYDDLPDRRLSSATALSTIIHPDAPRAPSVHVHISWTEMRGGAGSWRVMADLNPSIEDTSATAAFSELMRTVEPRHYEAASAQGDRYFYIPALGRHRGVTHYYLEGFSTGDLDADRDFARRFGERVIDGYLDILAGAMPEADAADASATEREQQLAYHTLYAFQVLTLDRGTTSGLLVHDQNDVGILGSLPARVDRDLLERWAGEVGSPQDELVRSLAAAMPEESPAKLSDAVRADLAQVVRTHYQRHPDALDMQARGDVIPPTVENHRARS